MTWLSRVDFYLLIAGFVFYVLSSLLCIWLRLPLTQTAEPAKIDTFALPFLSLRVEAARYRALHASIASLIVKGHLAYQGQGRLVAARPLDAPPPASDARTGYRGEVKRRVPLHPLEIGVFRHIAELGPWSTTHVNQKTLKRNVISTLEELERGLERQGLLMTIGSSIASVLLCGLPTLLIFSFFTGEVLVAASLGKYDESPTGGVIMTALLVGVGALQGYVWRTNKHRNLSRRGTKALAQSGVQPGLLLSLGESLASQTSEDVALGVAVYSAKTALSTTELGDYLTPPPRSMHDYSIWSLHGAGRQRETTLHPIFGY